MINTFDVQGSLSYSGQFKDAQNYTINMNANISYPETTLCSKNAALCSSKIAYNQSLNIKVAIHNISYNGIEDNTLCNFAGLAAYNLINNGS